MVSTHVHLPFQGSWQLGLWGLHLMVFLWPYSISLNLNAG